MRLWTIHPRYLDRQGLTGLWREALLAQAVLAGLTRGYRSHPQLLRFRAQVELASEGIVSLSVEGLILDQNMPGLDGAQTMERIRQDLMS